MSAATSQISLRIWSTFITSIASSYLSFTTEKSSIVILAATVKNLLKSVVKKTLSGTECQKKARNKERKPVAAGALVYRGRHLRK